MQGQRDRDQCDKPILEELQNLFPHRSKERLVTFLLMSCYSLCRLMHLIRTSPCQTLMLMSSFMHILLVCHWIKYFSFLLKNTDSMFMFDSPPTCLVPGAGLGRLALEISCLGAFSVAENFLHAHGIFCSRHLMFSFVWQGSYAKAMNFHTIWWSVQALFLTSEDTTWQFYIIKDSGPIWYLNWC